MKRILALLSFSCMLAASATGIGLASCAMLDKPANPNMTATMVNDVEYIYSETDQAFAPILTDPVAADTCMAFRLPEAMDTVFYPMCETDRAVVEQVVMAEAGSEPGAGIIAVANCLYNALLRTGGDLRKALSEYGYTSWRPEPTAEVCECVSAVFDLGELLLDEDVLAFCRSDCESAKSGWHSTLELVTTIGKHNFYKVP